MQLGMMLIWTAWVLIGVGLALLVSGILLSVRPKKGQAVRAAAAQQSLAQTLLELIKKSFVIVLSRTSEPWRKFAAAGMLLIYLGIVFLLVGLIPQIAMSGDGTDPAPAPSLSDEPTPSSP